MREMITEMIDEIMESDTITVDFQWWGGSFHAEAYVEDITVGEDYLRIENDFEIELDLEDVEIEKSEYMEMPIYIIKHSGVTGIVQNQAVYLTIIN